MEALPGTYALILRSLEASTIQVGRLGLLDVSPGWYVYVGSAFGPGGLQARVGRHQRRGGALHWHIDYLRRAASVEQVWTTLDPTPREHEWAQAFARLPGITIPLAGFGSSDCRCPAHLFYLPNSAALDLLTFPTCLKLTLPKP